MSFKHIILIACFLFSQNTLFAQQQLRFDDFLNSVIAEMDNLLIKREERTYFKPSPLEEIQLRTETQDLDPNRQEYLIRFKPASSKIVKAQSRYFDVYNAHKTFERKELKEDFIEAAYQDWLSIYFVAQKINYKKKWLTLLMDEETVINRLSLQPNNSIKELIAIQKKIADLKLEIYKEEQFLNLSLPNLMPDTTEMISVPEIMARLNLEDASQLPRKEREENDYELQLIDAETNIEMAEQKQYLDFIELKYRGPHENLFEEKIRIGLGFQLPFSDSRRLKMEELQMERELIQDEFMVESRLHEIKINKQKQEIELLRREWEYAQTLHKEIKTRSEELIRRASQLEGSDPLVIIKNNMDLIAYDLELLQIEESIFEKYVELLALTGKLFEEPIVNNLSK